MKHFLNLVIFTVFSLLPIATNAQSLMESVSKADTSNFSKNPQSEWQLLNSYLSGDGDSINIELILFSKNNELQTGTEQFIGTIKSKGFHPVNEKNIIASLITVEYKLRIDTNGGCFLSLIKGTPPKGENLVIPIMGKYIR